MRIFVLILSLEVSPQRKYRNVYFLGYLKVSNSEANFNNKNVYFGLILMWHIHNQLYAVNTILIRF